MFGPSARGAAIRHRVEIASTVVGMGWVGLSWAKLDGVLRSRPTRWASHATRMGLGIHGCIAFRISEQRSRLVWNRSQAASLRPGKRCCHRSRPLRLPANPRREGR